MGPRFSAGHTANLGRSLQRREESWGKVKAAGVAKALGLSQVLGTE